jgi:secondary thiamine-phosphate synthase enzyme
MYRATELRVPTRGRGLYPLTAEVQQAVAAARVEAGLCHVFVHHTSASVVLCENADPQVQRDLEAFLTRLVKDGDPLFRHDEEGPDDMPAHVRTVLTQSALTVPVRDGRADLGTWQGLYLYEHRTAPHTRRVTVSVLGGL